MSKADKEVSNSFQAWERAGGDSSPVNLEARFRDGNKCFLAYAYLAFCHFDQGGVIELHFTSRVLRLEGRNLGQLFAALARHAVAAVQEAESGEKQPERDAVIERIEIIDPNE